MDIDDIIRLLAIFFFIIFPVLRSITRRAQKMQPPKQTPPKGPTTSGSPVVTVPTSTVSNTTLSTDFEKKLAEAKRKVQEAMQQQGGLIKPEKTKDVGHESAEGLFQPQKPKLPAEMHGFPTPNDLHSPSSPSEFQQKARLTGMAIPEASHKGLTVAPPFQKVTSRQAKHVKLDKHVLLSKDLLSEQELTRGLLWQQILSEPKSKQKRRILSQPR
jgi:hypothetical protein